MPITRTNEDLLSSRGRPVMPVPAQDAPQHPATALVTHGASAAPAAALERDISGCIALIGPVQLCYDVNTSVPSIAISLKVGPVTVVSGEISPANPCLSFSGDYGLAKWDLKVCLRGSSVTLEGKVCVTFIGCKSFDITIIQW